MKRLTTYKVALVLLLCCSFTVLQIRSGQAVSVPAPAADVQLPPPVIGPNIPTAVNLGGATSPETARPFFDYFSWQSFAALNWPAAIGADGQPVRGVANTAAGVTIANPGKRVWESYKAHWELFTPNGATPTAWESYELPAGSTNPCGDVGDTDTLVMITKMDSVVDGINQALTGPLVDQNRNYVRYDIRVNKAYFDKVADPGVQWYLFEKQSRDPNRPNVFPDGVIELKAAWKELVAGLDDPSRYYTVNALVVQPGNVTPKCRQAQMGLIGFHIGNKVQRFREWVWSTFEHVDNVPEGAPVAGQKYSLNNGTNKPSTAPNGFDHMPPKIKDSQILPPVNDPQRNPVQVGRLTPISPSGQVGPTTDQINAQWQQALAGTVWQNYKLVTTQWPTVPNGQNFKVGGSFPLNSGTPFPAANVANTTMETYLQRNSCMRCHYAAAQDDFSFLLKEAFHRPPPLPETLSVAARAKRINDARMRNNPTEQKLLQVLAENDRRNKQAVSETNRKRRPRRGR